MHWLLPCTFYVLKRKNLLYGLIIFINDLYPDFKEIENEPLALNFVHTEKKWDEVSNRMEIKTFYHYAYSLSVLKLNKIENLDTLKNITYMLR